MPVRERNAASNFGRVRHRLHLCLAAGIFLGALSFYSAGPISTARAGEQSLASARLAAEIDEKLAQLSVKQHSVKLASEKALDVRHAIKEARYVDAREIISGVLKNSHLEHWRYYPFTGFIAQISDVTDPAFLTRLNEWVAQNPNDPIPVLIRARYYHDLGWFVRGSSFAKETKAEHLADFRKYLEQAIADVDTTIRLDDTNPYSFYLKLRILHGFGVSQRIKEAFEHAILKYPNYYSLYEIVLETLVPKWSGSVPAMLGFTDQYAGHVAGHSPLKLLYLVLYRDLLDSASTACRGLWRDKDKLGLCVASWMDRMVTPEVVQRVRNALQLYDLDNHQFNIAIRDILFSMLNIAGGEQYAGAFLELAAGAMHTDTQLKEELPGHNNYVIDEAVAESWYMKGFFDNSLKKGQEALKGIETATFPSQEEKDLALAHIDQMLSRTYRQLNQYADMIVHEKAAVAVGNETRDEHYICWGYYKLKDYDAAIESCTRAIDHNAANVPAHYWRGVAYRDVGKSDAALNDLTVVADSDHNFGASAVIDMSMIYFNMKDTEKALGVLNKYTFLYDPTTQNKSNIAVGYNNRCYAYMQLGNLKSALNDCTASLKYGSLPDAYRKQQELLRQLSPYGANP